MLDQKDKIKYVLAAVVVLAVAYAAAQYGKSVNSMYSSRTFTVEGRAKISQENSVATFTATIFTEGGLNQEEVQSKNAEASNKVTTYMQGKGVAPEDVKTENYTLQPKYSIPNCFGGRCEEAKIIGYTANQSITVKIREAQKAGELVSGAVENGATSVSEVRFTADDDKEKEVTEQARLNALYDAQQQAQRLAKAGKFQLGKMITFYEQGPPVEPYSMNGVGDMAMMEKSSVSSVDPQLQPGSSESEVVLVVTYEIR